MAVYPGYAFRRFGVEAAGLERLGSDYGGWFAPAGELGPESVVYSAGIGGDVTFDKALIKLRGCRIYGFDPTPTAIDFVANQFKAGELSSLFHFTPTGLWDSETTLTFFAPKTRGWVGSYSALNLQGTEDRESIAAPVRLCQLFPRLGNALAHAWTNQVQFESLLAALLTDRRGKRRGFSSDVRLELERLGSYRATTG